MPTCTALFNNSPNNRHSPDPSKTITSGDRNWEEIDVGFLAIAIPAPRDVGVVKLNGTARPAGAR